VKVSYRRPTASWLSGRSEGRFSAVHHVPGPRTPRFQVRTCTPPGTVNDPSGLERPGHPYAGRKKGAPPSKPSLMYLLATRRTQPAFKCSLRARRPSFCLDSRRDLASCAQFSGASHNRSISIHPFVGSFQSACTLEKMYAILLECEIAAANCLSPWTPPRAPPSFAKDVAAAESPRAAGPAFRTCGVQPTIFVTLFTSAFECAQGCQLSARSHSSAASSRRSELPAAGSSVSSTSACSRITSTFSWKPAIAHGFRKA
jgi:hypothetical protein